MSEAAEVYLRLKARSGGDARPRRRARVRDEAGSTVPFAPGREPRGVGAVLDSLTEELGWTGPLAREEVMALWPSIVGEETARHSEPVGIDDGVLEVRCDSTAWATQLRILRADLVTRIRAEHPEAGVDSIRFQGPDVPSWKRGPRSIPGRGPRDTYG